MQRTPQTKGSPRISGPGILRGADSYCVDWASLNSVPTKQIIGRGDDTVGNPHRAQISQFELFELILLSKLYKQFPVEQFEATVSRSTAPLPPLNTGARQMLLGKIGACSCDRLPLRRERGGGFWSGRAWMHPFSASLGHAIQQAGAAPQPLTWSEGGGLWGSCGQLLTRALWPIAWTPVGRGSFRPHRWGRNPRPQPQTFSKLVFLA